MALNQWSPDFDKKLNLYAKEQAAKKAGAKAGLRTGSSPPPSPSPILQGVRNFNADVDKNFGGLIRPSNVYQNYPSLDRARAGEFQRGNLYSPTQPREVIGSKDPLDPLRPVIGPNRVPGSVQAGIGGTPEVQKPMYANDAAGVMLQNEQKQPLAPRPYRGPSLANPLTAQSPIMRTPDAAPVSPATDPREFERRMLMLKQEQVANRAAAMSQPREMDYWKLSPQERATAYATKENAALNIGSLNRMGQDMTRARNPVAPGLANPEQAAESQQRLLKDAGQFGAFGPEPDLALRANLLAKEMAPRKAAAQRMDEEAMARDAMNAGDFRTGVEREKKAEADARAMTEAQQAAAIAMLQGGAAQNDAAVIAAQNERKIREAKERPIMAGPDRLAEAQAKQIEEAMQGGLNPAKGQIAAQNRETAKQIAGVDPANLLKTIEGPLSHIKKRFGSSLLDPIGAKTGVVKYGLLSGNFGEDIQNLRTLGGLVLDPLRKLAAVDQAQARDLATTILSQFPAPNADGLYHSDTAAGPDMNKYTSMLNALRAELVALQR